MSTRSGRGRISAISDGGSFREILTEPDSLYVNAECLVFGHRVLVSATDPAGGLKRDIFKSIRLQGDLLEKACEKKMPFILIADEAGPRRIDPDEPADMMVRLFADPRGMGRLFRLHGELSGRFPQIAVVCGPVTAALAFPPAFCDYVIMLESAAACLGNPAVVRKMIGKDFSLAEMAGPEMHTRVSGYADRVVGDEAEAFSLVRGLIPLVLDSKEGPLAPESTEWNALSAILSERHRSFDMHRVVASFIDRATLVEFKPDFAAEAITALARVEGRTIGIVANNSLHRSGLVFPETCLKMMRFMKFCDAFSIPLLFIADTPGFMVGKDVERSGIISRGSELFRTIASLRVPHMTLVARHAHTAGLYAMGGPGFNPALFCALPAASISIFEKRASERLMSSEGLDEPTANALRELASAEDSPFFLTEAGLLDRIVELTDVRETVRNFIKERP